MADAKVLIEAGSFVTCERGHLVCEVVEPITVCTLNWGRCFGHWRQMEPQIGCAFSTIAACDQCGANWIRCSKDLLVQTFIEGRGWV